MEGRLGRFTNRVFHRPAKPILDEEIPLYRTKEALFRAGYRATNLQPSARRPFSEPDSLESNPHTGPAPTQSGSGFDENPE